MLKIIHTDGLNYAVYRDDLKIASVHVDGDDVEKWGIVWASQGMKVGEIQQILDALRG